MFNYSDPVGRNFLDNGAVASEYRRGLAAMYESFARVENSAFTWIEAFDALAAGQRPNAVQVDWRAFPLLAGTSHATIDGNRFQLQDEYVEWRVETQAGRLARVTFVTEFPEYFQAFAAQGLAPLVAAVQDAIPGAEPTSEELFGAGFNAAAATPLARSETFRGRLPRNPWNNGEKGILCLTQRNNTRFALFNLVAECGVRLAAGAPEDTCGQVAGACGPGRSSDPVICSTAQSAVRENIGFTLGDPVGIRLVELHGDWRLEGEPIDINDPEKNRGAWVVSRNGRRGTLTVVPGLTLEGAPPASGAQISRHLQVAADLLTARNAALPDWARIGEESGSRGPG